MAEHFAVVCRNKDGHDTVIPGLVFTDRTAAKRAAAKRDSIPNAALLGFSHRVEPVTENPNQTQRYDRWLIQKGA